MLGDVPELVTGLRLLRGAILQMLLEELKHQLLGFRPPLQMGGGSDVQFGVAAAGSGRLEKVEETPQMRIPPAADQQHGFLEPGLRWAMENPALVLICRLSQPAQSHSLGVMLL